MQPTVTVRGFAWNATTRTHSDVVTFEASNRQQASLWIERMSARLENCEIIRNNDRFILSSLMQTFGHLPDCEVLEPVQ